MCQVGRGREGRKEEGREERSNEEDKETMLIHTRPHK